MRPSTYILSPFLQYFSTTSARPEPLVFHTTHRCHSVFSCFSPFGEFHCRLVASENVATRLPPVVDLTSGSLPRFPISITLFRLLLTVPPGESSCPAQNSIGRGQHRVNQRFQRSAKLPALVFSSPSATLRTLRITSASSTGRR